MDDPRPLGLLPTRDRVPEQSVDERPAPVARRGMDDDPGRLVDDEEVLVLVGDPKLHRLGLEPARCRARRLELDRLPAAQPEALRARRPVHEHVAGLHQPLGRRTRPDLRKRRQEAVEPLPGRLVRNEQAERR